MISDRPHDMSAGNKPASNESTSDKVRGNEARGGDERNAGPGTGGDDRRSNPALAAVVDQAIRFDAERGAALAWAYLTRHGVAPETILRVLAAPAAGRLPRRTPRARIDGAAS